jgi:alpha-glucosidase
VKACLRLAAVLAVFHAASARAEDVPPPIEIESPSGELRLVFSLNDRGRATFEIFHRKLKIVSASLGMRFATLGRLEENLEVVDVRRSARDRTYAIAVGKASSARDRHREMIVSLSEQRAGRTLEIAFRLFDEGAAFRYLIPDQLPLKEFALLDEATELAFHGDPKARYLPLGGYTTSYEKHYQSGALSTIDPEMLIGLPLLLERRRDDSSSSWIGVTEANLVDYAGMYLSRSRARPEALMAMLSPLPGRDDGALVVGKAPHASPWRVLIIGDDPGRLLESNLVFHLSDPPAIDDVSWIKPGRTTFPWWNGYVLEGVDFEPGLNTATHKHYIDFCAENGIEYHSLDGTDTAWYGGPIIPTGPTDITKSVPDIDLPELLRYAKEKGVRLRLWMHWRALAKQIDEAFPLYEKWGIEGVMVDFMDRDDQEMVAFYHEVAKKAAEHKLTVTWHGAYKPTGMERTWPNVLTYEAALNQEYNKWDARGTPPAHNLDIAFVRMLAGPLDYHQGGMRSVMPEQFKPESSRPPVQGTRCHQLAMYVVYQNHLPMMVDFPAAYRGQPGLDFIASVPVSWDETRVLVAELDQCIVVARRKSDAWYLGGMAGKEGQQLDLPLDFLGDGTYQAEMLVDDLDGEPTAVHRRQFEASTNVTLRAALAPGGGFVAKLSK